MASPNHPSQPCVIAHVCLSILTNGCKHLTDVKHQQGNGIEHSSKDNYLNAGLQRADKLKLYSFKMIHPLAM